MDLNRNRTGLIVGSFSGAWHVLWSFMVAIGIAQTVLDWIYRLHFLDNPFHVSGFNILKAAVLVTLTFVIGYLGGWSFAFLWNSMHKNDRHPAGPDGS